ncbi:RidA family protein [Parendozoicomonas haliclonae]|uniref:Enamine/imine deaminase n=1 Tax=Parendozoicomonas haliclonae TaxID=1960125 RepID=A0A1X7AG14_9GAMM|nr:RidA family protein [Parendozoicomonas haliclonae]SMA37557.1 Enamine/imine deaminase [Parendozoicomonas haliclonae]
MKLINAEKAPKAVGPYSHAVVVNNTLYISGQLPLDPETMQFVSDDVAEQTVQSLANLRSILEECGATEKDVAKVTVFLANMDDFGVVNGIYTEFFGDHKPARSCVQVAKLPMGAKVEIEAIALIG